jgi:hypothetical protein
MRADPFQALLLAYYHTKNESAPPPSVVRPKDIRSYVTYIHQEAFPNEYIRRIPGYSPYAFRSSASSTPTPQPTLVLENLSHPSTSILDILGPSRSPTPSLPAPIVERTSSRFGPAIQQARSRSGSRFKPASPANVAPTIPASANLPPPSDLAPTQPPQGSPSTAPVVLLTPAPEPLGDTLPLALLEVLPTALQSPVNILLTTQPPVPADPTAPTTAASRPSSPPVAFPRSLTKPFASPAALDPPNLGIKSKSTLNAPAPSSTQFTVEPRPMQRAPTTCYITTQSRLQ